MAQAKYTDPTIVQKRRAQRLVEQAGAHKNARLDAMVERGKASITQGLTPANAGEFDAARGRVASSRAPAPPPPQARPVAASSLLPNEAESFNRQSGGRFGQQFPSAPTVDNAMARTNAAPAGSVARTAALGEGVAAAQPAAQPRPVPAAAAPSAMARPAAAPRPSAGAGAGVLPIVGVTSAVGSMSRSTEDYRKRLGLDPAGPTGSPGVQLAKDIGVRAAGVASDLGANLLDIGTGVVNTARGLAGAEPIQTFAERFADTPQGPSGAQPAADFSAVSGGASPSVPADLAQRQQRQAANEGITPVGDRVGDPNEVLGNFNGRAITRGESDRMAAGGSPNPAPRASMPAIARGLTGGSPTPANPGQGAERRMRDISSRSTPAGKLFAELRRDTTPTGKRMASEFLSAYVGSGTIERGQDSARNTAAAETAGAGQRSANSDAAGIERERIASNRKGAPQYQIADDGSIIQLGDGVASPVMGPDGKPFRTKRGGGFSEKDISERLDQLDPGGTLTVEERRAERDRIVAELQEQQQALADGA